MKLSYQWLQEYFDEKLPNPQELAKILTIGVFEVENIEKLKDDWVLDIDVLPNRAHDCLSHYGVAREIGVLADMSIKKPLLKQLKSQGSASIAVDVKETALCPRYTGKVLNNIKIEPSPEWLKDRLEAVGQRSINNIVDITNYIMLDIGQPMHAFDLDKIEGGKIVIRMAKKGETITTLDGTKVELDESILVVADNKLAKNKDNVLSEPLAIAGVKGGVKAEIDENTTRIVLEAASFQPVTVRKTSRSVGILTDSSKRFENGLTAENTENATERATALIQKILPNIQIIAEETIDVYTRKRGIRKIGITRNDVNKITGINFSDSEIKNILCKRLGFEVKEIANPLELILSDIKKHKGAPYKYGASVTYDAPRFFDCSSFVSFLFAQAGVAIPRMSVDQFVFGEPIKEQDIVPGDIIFSNTGIMNQKIDYKSREWLPGTVVPSGVDHCGVYIGGGKVIHSTKAGDGVVVVEDIKKSERFDNVVGYRRMITHNTPRFVVSTPKERLDLQIKEDVVEEILRVYGYDKINSEASGEKNKIKKPNSLFYFSQLIRNIMVENGFSEVYTYSFRDSGLHKIKNPIAENKGFLRKNLSDGFLKSLNNNIKYADLLGVNKIKIFEIGKIFTEKGEQVSFAIGVKNKKGIKPIEKTIINNVLLEIKDKMGVISGDFTEHLSGVVFESNFEDFIKTLSLPGSYGLVLENQNRKILYKAISQYPFVTRDIAVWVPKLTKQEEVLKTISAEAELLARKPVCFDLFEKDNKVSYAFSLVFQSCKKTLTDSEVNKIMDKIVKTLTEKKWEVR